MRSSDVSACSRAFFFAASDAEFEQRLAALLPILRRRLLSGHLHDHLLFLRHQGIDLLHDFGRHIGIGGRADGPRPIVAEIDVAKERAGGATLLRGQTGVNLRSSELDHLLQLGRRILTIERAQGFEQTVRPPGHGIAVIAEDFELATHPSRQLRRSRRRRRVGIRAIQLLPAQMRFEGGGRNDLQDTRLTETIRHEIMA